MASKKKCGKKAGTKQAQLRDLPRADKDRAELSAEQARKVKGGSFQWGATNPSSYGNGK
jgi:hypothetical protein